LTTVPDIKHSIVIDAPVEKVWEALISPQQVAQWLGAVGFAPQVGHKFHFQADPQPGWDGVTHSEVVEITPPTRLVFTWFVPGTPVTQVTFTLRDLADKTEVILEHTGWDQFPPEVGTIRDQLDYGWSHGVLPNLQNLFARA
jgi:uncharacterized protein YndB with AHSA1/START domain